MDKRAGMDVSLKFAAESGKPKAAQAEASASFER
jgi:hypothetical protein